MRTSWVLLVQTVALVWAVGVAAQATGNDYDYGTHEARAGGAIHARAPAAQSRSPDPRRVGRPPATPRAGAHTDVPARGLRKAQVVKRYGRPAQRHAAVGKPPITRWDYPDYRVYFEYDRVVHSVKPGALEPVTHTGALAPLSAPGAR